MSSPPHESLHPVVVHSPLRPFTLPPSSSSTPNNTPSFRHRVLSSTASTGKGQRTRVYDFRDPASPVFRPAGLDDVCKEGSKGGATSLWSVDLQLETEDINSTSTTPDHSPRAQLEWRNTSLGRGSDDRRRLAYESAGGRRGSAGLREVMSEQGSPTPVGRTSRRERKRTRTESLAGGGGSYFADQKLGGRPGLNPPSVGPRAQRRPQPHEIPELLQLILSFLLPHPSTLLSTLLVSSIWFELVVPVLWSQMRFEDCARVFEMVGLIAEGGKWGRKERMITREVLPLPKGTAERHALYCQSVQSVHITEIVLPGQAVDILILRRKYPSMTPFTNLRWVYLHRLSPHAFYLERFSYRVVLPEMWLELTSTTCLHRLDVLSTSTAKYDTRYLYVSPRDLEYEARSWDDPATLVWVQTSVFVHYDRLKEFALDMPSSWSLQTRYASDLLRAIATSTNRTHLERLTISCPLPVLDPVPSPPTVDERGVAFLPPRLSIPDGALLLFSLHNLTHVNLRATFTDAHLVFLTQAWSKLRSLVIVSPSVVEQDATDRTGRFWSPSLSVKSLRTVADNCRSLERLELDLKEPPSLPSGTTIEQLVAILPVFGGRVEKIVLTGWGWTAIDRSFLAGFVLGSIPTTCELEIRAVKLKGLEDLFEGVEEGGGGEGGLRAYVDALRRKARRTKVRPLWLWSERQ